MNQPIIYIDYFLMDNQHRKAEMIVAGAKVLAVKGRLAGSFVPAHGLLITQALVRTHPQPLSRGERLQYFPQRNGLRVGFPLLRGEKGVCP